MESVMGKNGTFYNYKLPSTSTTLNEEDDAIKYAGALTSSFIFPMVLNACIELNVLEILNHAGPGAQLSPHSIASRLPGTNRNPDTASVLDRMLYLLASYDLLTCSVRALEDSRVQRRYGLTLAGNCFVRSAERGSFAWFSLLNRHQAIMDMRFRLKEAVLEGGFTFEKAHGMSIYQYNEIDPVFGEAFNGAMSQFSTLAMKQILEKYEGFEGLSSLVDVGGGIGSTLNLIISKYPAINKAIKFDLSEILRNAPPYNIGIEHVGGDMFKEVPKGDAILLKLIIHNWNDEQCLKILTNCYKALRDTGKVIVIDSVLPETPEATNLGKFVTQNDNIMFSKLGAGKERMENEFKILAIAAGFSTFRVACCVSVIYSVMELRK